MRFLASWFFYCLGHLVSLPMRWLPLYPVYSWLMRASFCAQGWEVGPWRGPWKMPRKNADVTTC